MAELKQNAQSQELASNIWAIANDLRGNMDASKFKDYILGTIFYRYLSERTEKYMAELLENDGMTYEEALAHPKMAPVVKKWAIKHLGYVLEPKYFFKKFVEDLKSKDFSIEDYEAGISSLVGSTVGEESEAAFDKLFDDMDLKDKDLGKEVSDRTELIGKVINKINELSFDMDDAHIDVLGTAYMILIGLFASGAGKKAGEFFSANCLCDICNALACVGLEEVDSACDPCGGSANMLLRTQKYLKKHNVTHYYYNEKISSTYNMGRMSLLMHGIPYKKFTAHNEDILKKDCFDGEFFDVTVANPPYSVANTAGTSDFLDDERYKGAGVLAPKKAADLAFVEHIAYHMSDKGRAAILMPHGVLFRGGAELAIRKYLIENMNCIDAVVGLPAKLFQTTSIPILCLVLKKYRNGDSNNILFIDASKEFVAGKVQNTMTEEHIQKIVDAYVVRKDIEKFAHVATLDEIRANGYNLNIPRYIDTFEKEAEVDISAAFADLGELDAKEQVVDDKLKGFFARLGIEVKL